MTKSNVINMSTLRSAVMNRARDLTSLFERFVDPTSLKHDHYQDFGYPSALSFQDFQNMYARNGFAFAITEKIKSKIWEDWPKIVEDDESDEESSVEKEIRNHLEDICFWQSFGEADQRSLVGNFAALILRIADNKPFSEPVDGIDSIKDIVEAIPVWQDDIKVSKFETDENDENYGKPKQYTYNEKGVEGASGRQVDVHPDRIIIFSKTRTIDDSSLFEHIFNDLLDIEKIKGSGAEGFWKNSKGSPVMEIDKEASVSKLAEAMGGIPVEEVPDKMQEIVEDYNKGFDKALVVQGMKVEFPQIQLSDPEKFFTVCLNSIAAATGIPFKILVGMQTGERASKEDAKEFDRTIMSRRKTTTYPLIRIFIRRLVEWGALEDIDWKIEQRDLTESSAEEALLKAEKMTKINKENDEPVFENVEIRKAAGYNEELPDVDKDFDDDDEEDDDDEQEE
jgi:hypothetical protein